LRVIELGGGIAGSYCTKLMAGFGADVIKVEPWPAGDKLRQSEPFIDGASGPENSIPHLWYNTGKRSVVLNLDSKRELDWLKGIIRRADVVVDGFAPGKLAEIGLGFDVLKSVRRDIILTSITPFGQSGPNKDYEAEEITLYAMSGLMYATGHPDREPLAAGPAICQLSAGMKAYIATLMAVYRRKQAAGAEWIDVSVHEAALDNFEIAVAEHMELGKKAKRANDEHALVPWRIFPCRDGHAAIIGGPIRHWLKAAEIFEEPELTSTKYAHMADRIRQRADVRALMAPWLSRHDKKDIFHAGQKRKMAWGYLATLADVVGSPQHRARGFLPEVHHPDHGHQIMLGAPFRPSRSPWRQQRAPQLGEHTSEVLQELLGLSPAEIGAAKEGALS
jgi:crotonobetainyl-CoA:carnitine CoA-transferase CaiB-like acyl-CoA transferase